MSNLVIQGTKTEKVDVQVTEADLGHTLLRIVWERTGRPDDAGCDWTTDENGNTCINGDPEWVVSTDPTMATLVDAANILIIGAKLKASNKEA